MFPQSLLRLRDLLLLALPREEEYFGRDIATRSAANLEFREVLRIKAKTDRLSFLIKLVVHDPLEEGINKHACRFEGESVEINLNFRVSEGRETVG